MKEIQKDILLYWSGEADYITMQRVRECLEWDSEARSYLNDLEAINTEFKTSKKKHCLWSSDSSKEASGGSTKRGCSGRATNYFY